MPLHTAKLTNLKDKHLADLAAARAEVEALEKASPRVKKESKKKEVEEKLTETN